MVKLGNKGYLGVDAGAGAGLALAALRLHRGRGLGLGLQLDLRLDLRLGLAIRTTGYEERVKKDRREGQTCRINEKNVTASDAE